MATSPSSAWSDYASRQIITEEGIEWARLALFDSSGIIPDSETSTGPPHPSSELEAMDGTENLLVELVCHEDFLSLMHACNATARAGLNPEEAKQVGYDLDLLYKNLPPQRVRRGSNPMLDHFIDECHMSVVYDRVVLRETFALFNTYCEHMEGYIYRRIESCVHTEEAGDEDPTPWQHFQEKHGRVIPDANMENMDDMHTSDQSFPLRSWEMVHEAVRLAGRPVHFSQIPALVKQHFNRVLSKVTCNKYLHVIPSKAIRFLGRGTWAAAELGEKQQSTLQSPVLSTPSTTVGLMSPTSSFVASTPADEMTHHKTIPPAKRKLFDDENDDNKCNQPPCPDGDETDDTTYFWTGKPVREKTKPDDISEEADAVMGDWFLKNSGGEPSISLRNMWKREFGITGWAIRRWLRRKRAWLKSREACAHLTRVGARLHTQ